MNHMKKTITAVLLLGGVLTGNADTRTLLKSVGKDVNGGYPKTWEQMSGIGYWAALGSESDKLEAGFDYVIPTGKNFSTPQAASGTLVFPGDTLIVESGATMIIRHTGSTVDFGERGIVMRSKIGLLNYSGSRGGYSRSSSQAYIRGTVNIESSETVKINHMNNVNVGETFYGPFSLSAGARLDCIGATGWDAVAAKVLDARSKRNSVEFLGDTTELRGHVSVQTNMYVVVGENGLGNAASVTFYGNEDDRAYSASLRPVASESVRFVDVNNLTLHGAALEIPVTSGASTGVRATGSLTVDGVIDVYLSRAAANCTVRTRYAVLTAPCKLSAADFAFAGAFDNDDSNDTTFANPNRLVVEDDDASGGSTLYVEVDPVIYCDVNAKTGNTGAENYFCQLTNAMSWSDHELPHAGAAYVCMQSCLRGPLNNESGSRYGAYEFPGYSLTLGPTTTFYETYSDFYCEDLRLMAGSKLMLWNSGIRQIRGKMTVCPGSGDGVVRLIVYQNREETIKADIRGAGVLQIGGNNSSGTPMGTVILAGDNSAFAGKMLFATGTKASNPVLPAPDQQFNVRVSADSHLGGALPMLTADAITLEDYTLLTVLDDMSVAENRGLTVNLEAEISVAAGKTATFSSGLTLNGELVKSGEGTLALGGTFAAGAAGNAIAVRTGCFKPLSSACVDGAALRLDGGTKIVYDFAVAPELAETGLTQSTAGSSVSGPTGMIDVEIVGADNLAAGKAAVLMTGTQEQCLAFARTIRTITNTVGRKRPRAEVVEQEGGVYTVQADLSKTGFLLIFR